MPCVNPKHLFLSDVIGNLNDMRVKGRHAHGKTHGSKTHPECWAKGSDVGSSKLDAKDVFRIRKLYDSGKFSQYELGERFGVHKRYVWLIVNRKTWKHI